MPLYHVALLLSPQNAVKAAGLGLTTTMGGGCQTGMLSRNLHSQSDGVMAKILKQSTSTVPGTA